jgi:hypothetical protein
VRHDDPFLDGFARREDPRDLHVDRAEAELVADGKVLALGERAPESAASFSRLKTLDVARDDLQVARARTGGRSARLGTRRGRGSRGSC